MKNKGISSFIALSIMTTLLLMALGLSSIVSPQIKMTGEIGKSVKAFHAADSGIERLSEAIYVGYDYYDYSSLSGQCDEKTIWGTPTDVICECPEAQRDCSYMTEGRCNNTVCLGYCGEENGFVCLSGEYCREVDHRCQPLPVCRQRIEDGYGTTNVADNIQVEGCNNTCYACNGSGRCVGKTCDYSAATALGCIAGTESCRYCDAGNCDFYTFGEHECEMGHKCNREGECAALCETNEEGITACIEINYSGLATQITSFTIDAPDGIQVDKTISLSAKLTYVSDGIAIADETIFFEDTTGDGENPIPIGDATTLSDGVATKNYLIPGGAIIGEHILTAKYAGNRLKLALSSENTTTFDVLNTEPTVDDAYIKPPVPGFTDTLICNFTISDINILDDLTADVTWYKSINEGETWLPWTQDDETGINVENGVEGSTSPLGNIEFEKTALDELWKCKVTAHDGWGTAVEKESSPIKIISYDPEIVSVSIDPLTPLDINDLHCKFKVDDHDTTDILTADVIWYKKVLGAWSEQQRTESISIENGVEYTTSGAQSLSNILTNPDEQWFCKVIAHDGHETADIRPYCSNDVCLWLSLYTNSTRSLEGAFHITDFGGRDVAVSPSVGIAEDCQISNGVKICVYVYKQDYATQLFDFISDKPEAYPEEIIEVSVTLKWGTGAPQEGNPIVGEKITFYDTTDSVTMCTDAITNGSGIAFCSYQIPGTATLQDHTLKASYSGNRLLQALPIENSSLVVTVLNTEPEIVGTPYITPLNPGLTDDLICNFKIHDDNSDDDLSATITWYKNGGSFQVVGPIVVVNDANSFSPGLFIGGNTDIGDKWKCKVQAHDSHTIPEITKTSAEVEVADYDPEIISIFIDPSTPLDTDNLHCKFKVTDADTSIAHPETSDTLTADVLWYKKIDNTWSEQQRTESISIENGVEYTTSGAQSLSNILTNPDEQWLCKVIAHDGHETASIRKYCSNDVCLWVSLYKDTTQITNFGGRDVAVSAARGISTDCQTSNGVTICVCISKNDYATQIPDSSFTSSKSEPDPGETITLEAELRYDYNGDGVVDTNDTPIGGETIYFKDITDPDNVIDMCNDVTDPDGVASCPYIIPGDATTGVAHTIEASYEGNRLIQTLPSENSSLIITIKNIAPEIVGTPYVTPLNPGLTDDLICNFKIHDDNSDDDLSATITWYKDSVQFRVDDPIVVENDANSVSIPLSLEGNTIIGDKWKCKVQAHDSHTIPEITKTSAEVEVADYDPVVTSISITPSTPLDTDNLRCKFTVTDSDTTDTLTADVLWYKKVSGDWEEQTEQRKEGISITSGAEYTTPVDPAVPANGTVGAGDITADEQWLCKVIAHDGHETASIRKYCSNDVCLWVSIYEDTTQITNFGGRDVAVSPSVGIAEQCDTSEGVTICVTITFEYPIVFNTEPANTGQITFNSWQTEGLGVYILYSNGGDLCEGVLDNTQVSGCDGECEACQGGSCGLALEDTDPGNHCGEVSCEGYYYGWKNLICYASSDVPAGHTNCNAEGSCKDEVDYCPYDIGETRKICDFTGCQPSITYNDSLECGLSSKCNIDDDCICPKDKCIKYNYYRYPLTGICLSGKCEYCEPIIETNSPICKYDPTVMEICEYDSDCSCPVSKCISLEPDSIGDYFGFPWETPYHGILPNGAEYKTYINKDPDLTEYFMKSIGEFKGVKRAIEISF